MHTSASTAIHRGTTTMTRRTQSGSPWPHGRLAGSALCLAVLLGQVGPAVAAPALAMPDTAVGKLATQLMAHVQSDSPAQVRAWADALLSPQMDAADRANFLGGLESAVRDSGGLEWQGVREQHGLLILRVKARRTGQHALIALGADAAQSGQLAQADIVEAEDPALYANWPNKVASMDELARLIQGALDQLVRRSDFSGCVAVSDGGATVFDECRGVAERSFAAPIDRATRFHVGSVNKMFTAVAVAQLVESGQLQWGATLAQLVPEYPDQAVARKITVWQLLHHTAGLGDYLVPDYFAQRERFTQPLDHLGLIAKQTLVGEPGDAWAYSNAGYMLLGRIIENVSGERYAHYIQRHVFAPAGMQASGFNRLDEVVPKLATGYYRDGMFSSLWRADWLKTEYQSGPAGGGYSTAADLLRFAQALREGKLVDARTLAKMFEDPVPAGPGGYAAGFGERLSHGQHIRGHAGGIEGTSANLAIVWERGAAVALTSNQGPSQTWMLAERIADLLAAGLGRP